MALPSVLMALLLCAAVEDPSIPDWDVLSRAESAFAEGCNRPGSPWRVDSFRQAAEGYEELHRRGYRNPDLLRAHGTAALLAGDLPAAVLAFHRGLVLAPNDRDLRDRLAYARAQVVYPTPERLGRPAEDHWPPGLPRPSPTFVLALAGLCYTAGCLGLARWLTTRDGVPWSGVEALVLAAGLGIVTALFVRQQRWEAAHPLVVVAQDGVVLRKGNGRAYPPRHDTPLHRGAEARLRFERGDWLQVELTGGTVGWLPRAAVLLDTPGSVPYNGTGPVDSQPEGRER